MNNAAEHILDKLQRTFRSDPVIAALRVLEVE